MHYQRMRKAGTLPAKETPADRFWAKVDKSGECWEWLAFKDRDGYGKFMSPGLPQYAHRTAWHFLRGPIPQDMQLDHLCHNRGCVNPEHLRVATNQENQQNLRGPRATSKSGVLGVHWASHAKKWAVQIKHDDRSQHVGYFDSIEAADAAAVAARAKLFTHFQGPDSPAS